MSKKNLRKLLQGQAKFNPFNDNFNYEELVIKLSNANDYDSSIASNTPVFNMYFKEMYKYFKKFITDYDVSSEVLMRYFIGVANNDYLALQGAFKERVKTEHSLEELSSMRVPSSNEHIGDMNIITSVETIVDILNIIINYLRFFANRQVSGNVQESEIRRDVLRIYSFSNIYYNIKNVYDTVLWEEGYIEDKKGNLYLRYIDKQYSINRMVGVFRQQKNIFNYLIILENILNKTEVRAATFKKSLMTKRKPVAIKTTSFNSKGIISYTLSTDKSNLKINEYMKKGQAAIVAYYPHLEYIKLPKLNNLTINDLLVLFTQLNELIAGIEKFNINLKSSSLKQLAFRIQEKELIKYLLKTTFYSEMDIKAFLLLIGADGNSNTRLNLWKTPLIKYRNMYYVCMAGIIAPNFLYLIDEWLEDGGYGIELKERGKLFEKFVKNTTKEHLIEKQIHFNIPNNDKFYNAKNEYEEIDLIISLEGLLIVAELKNIKYPMEPRDNHNSMKRLREGAEQAKRKAKFLVRNHECFIEELGDITKKKVLPLVLTNFSIFSGLKLDGVPVLDLVLLESYIGAGEFTRLKLELTDNQKTLEKKEVIKYYKNDYEFILNFSKWVNNPLPIQDLKEKAYVEDRVITLKTAKPQIHHEIADFKIIDPVL